MSGPLPKGDAPLRGEMEFGQGERGAAGFFDSGGSELVMSGGQLLGGYESGATPELPAGTFAPVRRPNRAKTAPAGLHKQGRTEKPIQSPKRAARPSTPPDKTGGKARKPAA